MPRKAFDQAEVVAVAPVPSLDGTAGQGQGGKRHHASRVEKFPVAQSVAGRAGAHRRVEREQPRFELADRELAYRTGELRVEHLLVLAVGLHNQRPAVGDPQCRFQAFGQTLPCVGAHLQPVDHHVDVVLLRFAQAGQGVGLEQLAIDPKAHIALGLHLREHVLELALAIARDGRQHQHTRVFGPLQHGVHHLRDGLRRQRQPVVGAVRRAGTRKQQPQVVVDFGDGAHGGAWVVRSGFLLDRDRRRQAFDHVHIGLVHALQELPGVGAQAFHIAALAFGVQGVKGQRRFA